MRKETSAAGETRVRQSDDETENTACLERKHREGQEKNLTRDAEKGRNEINHPAFGERKKAASMETEWRMGSVKAQRGLGFLLLEGEVDACRYCTLGVHHPARWMSCFTKANDATNPGCVRVVFQSNIQF
jgi:hypothetical protein